MVAVSSLTSGMTAILGWAACTRRSATPPSWCSAWWWPMRPWRHCRSSCGTRWRPCPG
ncbi:hypothetical protein ACFFX0_13025 [Citricoccus parietis]|uniref:Uncharacterized protein n=1 Tax=Citricoccus parietis TaxID=592307 RepID=A0ABV5FZI0_9MICC